MRTELLDEEIALPELHALLADYAARGAVDLRPVLQACLTGLLGSDELGLMMDAGTPREIADEAHRRLIVVERRRGR